MSVVVGVVGRFVPLVGFLIQADAVNVFALCLILGNQRLQNALIIGVHAVFVVWVRPAAETAHDRKIGQVQRDVGVDLKNTIHDHAVAVQHVRQIVASAAGTAVIVVVQTDEHRHDVRFFDIAAVLRFRVVICAVAARKQTVMQAVGRTADGVVGVGIVDMRCGSPFRPVPLIILDVADDRAAHAAVTLVFVRHAEVAACARSDELEHRAVLDQILIDIVAIRVRFDHALCERVAHREHLHARRVGRVTRHGGERRDARRHAECQHAGDEFFCIHSQFPPVK